MAKYIVRYESREYYEKEYEAESFDEAHDAFYADDRLWEGTPYDSETSLIEIENQYEGTLSFDA